MTKATFIFKLLLLIVTIELTMATGIGSAYGVGGYAGVHGGGQGVGQIHMPYQLLNILDLLIPFHVRVATDGIKHKPILRVPLLELAAHGQLNQPSIVHLVHGPGIPW